MSSSQFDGFIGDDVHYIESLGKVVILWKGFQDKVGTRRGLFDLDDVVLFIVDDHRKRVRVFADLALQVLRLEVHRAAVNLALDFVRHPRFQTVQVHVLAAAWTVADVDEGQATFVVDFVGETDSADLVFFSKVT